MCGRFARTSPAEVIVEEFGVTSLAVSELGPRYNVCPGERIAAIVEFDGGRRLGELHWGLGSRGQINVRAEGATSHPMFREGLRRHRCLIVADGFYEWQRRDSTKVPYFIRPVSRRPLAFGGIWVPDGGPAKPAAAAILTCPARGRVAEIHHRMPVIIAAADAGRWLDRAVVDAAVIASLLRPLADDQLEAYRVSTFVNTAINDSPECLRPVERALRLVERNH